MSDAPDAPVVPASPLNSLDLVNTISLKPREIVVWG
jgi:hypothetical protein